MKRFVFLFALLFSIMSFSQDNETGVLTLLKERFNKEFPNAIQPKWSKVYRGEYNEQARYEVEFLRGHSKFLVSYSNNGNIKAIEESMAVKDLKKDIVKYIKNFYPAGKIIEASVVVKEDKKKFFNVGVSIKDVFKVFVFSEDGTFLYKDPSDD